MNSYFEQSGFYGGHHQSAGASAASHHHHDQTAAAAAYRSFPLSLGMSPYASTQHHHHTLAHQAARPPQESPYDASVAAACKLYSSSSGTVAGNETAQQQSYNSNSGSKADCSKVEQNGYAAAVKDLWQSTTTGGSANSLVAPVRPAACTPDSRVSGYGGTTTGVGLGGDSGSSPGAGGGGRTSNSLSSWNNPCSLNTSVTQPVSSQLHQQTSNHTFYPWMAIAG